MATNLENDGQVLAEIVAQELFKKDTASQALGIRLEKVGRASARLSVVVTKSMLNGVGTCHGGVIFTLADSAFAYACNSRNEKTVALSCSINYLIAAGAGDVLTAVAREYALKGKTGLYDVEVTNAVGDVVAAFRGTSYKTRQLVVNDLPGVD